MISRFFRVFFWAILISSAFSWLYLGFVSATARQAIIVLHRKKGMPDLVGPGDSRFYPGRIFPGRVELHPVDIGPRNLQIEYKKALYQTEMLGLDDTFNIKFKLRFRYMLNPDKLPELFLKMESLDWKSLEPYIQLRLYDVLNKRMAKLFPNDNDLGLVRNRLVDYLAAPAMEEFKESFDKEGIEIKDVLVENVYVPEQGRYTAILGGAQQIINQKLERIRRRDEALAKRDAESLTDEAMYSRLDTIGKLIIKYPGLKDYLAVDRLSEDVKVMVFPYDRWFSNSQAQSEMNDALKKAPNGDGEKKIGGFQNLTPP